MRNKNFLDIRLVLASQEQSTETVTISNKIPIEDVIKKYEKIVKQLKLNKKRVIEIVKIKDDIPILVKIDLTKNLKRIVNQLLPKMREKYKETFKAKTLLKDFDLTKDITNKVLNILSYFDIIEKEGKEYKFTSGSEFKYIN